MKNIISFVLITLSFTLAVHTKEKERQSANEEIDKLAYITHEKEYTPNPIILDGVGQIMNGAIAIAQNPHNRPNLGHSIAAMIHGIVKIIIEKLAHKKNQLIYLDNSNELSDKLSAEITNEVMRLLTIKGLL